MSSSISIVGSAAGADLIAAMAMTGTITMPTGTASVIMTAIVVIATNAVADIKDTASAETGRPARILSGRLSLCSRLL